MPRILVADDNSNIQKMVALAFEEHGIDVVAVGNGEAAVRRIPDLNPDVVLADVFMPVRNGYEVCEFVKKDPRFAKVPVILLVGAFDPLDEQEARRVGADGVLKKPFVPPDPLIAMVTSALEKAPKPEVKATAETLPEIPKIAPPPPPTPEVFPEPTPEEEAYMFGTGRRSLDEDDKTESAAPLGGTSSAPAAVQTAVDADAEDDTTFAATRSDWRRQKEVDFTAVPSFSAELVDAPADVRAEANATPEMSAFAEARAEAPVAEANPFAAQAEPESLAQTIVEPEAPVSLAPAPFIAPVVESVQPKLQVVGEPKTVEDVAALIAPPVVETAAPEPPVVARVEEPSVSSEPVAAVPAEPVVAAPVEVPPALVEPPVAKEEVTPAKLEPSPAVETAPSVASVVEAVKSPRKWLDFLLPTRTPRPSEGPAESRPNTPAPQVREQLAAPPPTAEAVPAAEAPSISGASAAAPLVSEGATPAAPLAEAPVVHPEATHTKPFAAEVPAAPEPPVEQAVRESGQQWSEIASQLAAEAPLVEAAQSAINAEAQAQPEPHAPIFAPDESPAPVARVSEPEARSSPPFSAAESQASASLASEPESIAAIVERAASYSQAPSAPPNVDEVVNKILEKLGPQIQELLAKGVVRPLVEDLLKNPDDKKK